MHKSKILFVLFIGVVFYSKVSAQNTDHKLQQIIQEKRAYNLNHNEVIGYRIQLFNGISETKARSVQANFMTQFPEVSVRLFFEQPEWKVQVGNYRTKLEAHKALQKIQEEFAGAFPLKTKIKIE